MDKLVKRLLELMKLEYEDRKFNDQKFDLVELINSVIKNSKVVIKEEKINRAISEKVLAGGNTTVTITANDGCKIESIDISISHCKDYAVANVIVILK